MLITGDRLTDLNLLTNGKPENIRGSSYYLRIHSIIPAGDDAKTYNPPKPLLFHTLEPGGLAWVISEEMFHIEKSTMTALVTLRSGFTKQGMLALDVGLVDANFFGPIGSLVINFSSKPIRLESGSKFFRVLFFQHDDVEGDQIPERVDHDHESYTKKILEDFVGNFSSSFLQTAEMKDRIRKELKSDLVDQLEPTILDRITSRFFSKNKGFLIFVAAALLGFGFLASPGQYLHTEEQIKEIIKLYRLEQKEENP